ncbi:MATE family efflux transporter [Alloacidobacterium sp.]|uniref:MATE family efflux transporter n=1 Tax=Alloacidobacterium sp. TaxID=2951999 RepID=UPI002D2DC5E9|nr:MATE family efflux transporter [Alloacidobacterium sp.]HYK36629.1 MATE family efflux transporter [Alloacidobacterium sp.]
MRAQSAQTGLKEELRSLLALAIPVILSELGWMSMSIVDTIMVGRLSAEAIGAVGMGNAIYYAPALFGIGILLGLDTLVSQAYGRGDFDECHRWLSQGVYIALAFTPVLMVFLWAAPLAFPYLRINPAVSQQTSDYLRVLNWGTLPLLLYAGFRRYLQGVKRVGPVTFALISANLINWGGNWALIYGHLGFPAMGVRGSALSTCLARVYMAAVLIFAAWKNEAGRGHPLFAHWPGIALERLRGLLKLGVPAAGQIVMEVGAFGAATVMAGRLAPAALAAHQIALNCAAFSYMVPLGTSAAAAVAVGHAVGAGDGPRARRAGWLALAIGVSFMACAAVVFLLAPHAILVIYTNQEAVVEMGVPLLALAAAFQIFDGIQTISTGALRGLGETRMPMLANFAGYWIFGLPLGYVLCFRHGRGIFGLWTGLTLALIFIALVLLFQWRRDSSRLALATLP